MSEYHDIDIFGREKADGSALEFFDEEAIKNAVKLWLTSKKGEFLYQPEEGGVLERALFKNMEGDSMTLFLFTLKNAMINNFAPSITPLSIELVPNYETRLLEIEITYRNNTTDSIQTLNILTKDVPKITEQLYQDVLYTGENLKMYCLMKKPDMDGHLLVYDPSNSVWRWGLYNFVNLVETDAFFNEILSICNS